MTNQELKNKAESKAIEHVNYLCRMRGSQFPYKQMQKAIKTWTQRMYDNPKKYGVI